MSDNKRIAKNTVMLYIRMLLSVVVSLYTSRVVLEVLGVEDYGLYGLVGGVVSMFSFLNSTMAGATSRFLTFEMGKGDENRLKATFSSSLIIHIGIAILVLILVETIGLWFLNNKLVIPEGRMSAAHWVLQLSVLGMFVSFTQVPYNAAIIAHEKMDVYAYVELLHVFLKLGIVYLLSIGNFDKLIFYAFLVLVVNVIVAFTYRFYCIKNYSETRFSFVWDKDIIKPMLVFSGWEGLGNFGFTFRTQGVNFVLNMFFGVAVNAITGIATTVQNILLAFAQNVIVAIKPQIIKCYSLGRIQDMLSIMMHGIRFNLLFQLMLTLPLIVCMDYILQLWLVNPPTNCSSFCQIMLCSNILSSVSHLIYTGIQATGKLRLTSILRNIFYIGTPFLIYLSFTIYDFPPVLAYVIILLTQIILAVIEMFIFARLTKIFDLKMLFIILLKSLFIIILVLCLGKVIISLELNNLLKLIFVILSSETALLMAFYYFIFDKEEKQLTKKYIQKILSIVQYKKKL